MDKETQQQSNRTKLQLSLAALMFFSPLVKNIVKKSNFELQETEKDFIYGYVKFGYISLIMLIITILIGISSYRIESSIINGIYTTSIIILIMILIIGTICIIMDINIITKDKGLIDIYNEHITTNKKEIILNYIPIYNIYVRYNKHNFEKPNLLIKESILAWIIFVVSGIITTPFWTSIVLIIIIIRIASLLGGIDIINPRIKSIINATFLKNPEELRGYIKGTIVYAYRYITNKNQKQGITEYINEVKTEFSLLYNVQLQNSVFIKIQYTIGIIISIIIIKQYNRNLRERNTLIPLLILLGRYIIMLFQWHHLPPLPLYKEITDIGMHIYEKTKPRFYKIKSHFHS